MENNNNKDNNDSPNNNNNNTNVTVVINHSGLPMDGSFVPETHHATPLGASMPHPDPNNAQPQFVVATTTTAPQQQQQHLVAQPQHTQMGNFLLNNPHAHQTIHHYPGQSFLIPQHSLQIPQEQQQQQLQQQHQHILNGNVATAGIDNSTATNTMKQVEQVQQHVQQHVQQQMQQQQQQMQQHQQGHVQQQQQQQQQQMLQQQQGQQEQQQEVQQVQQQHRVLTEEDQRRLMLFNPMAAVQSQPQFVLATNPAVAAASGGGFAAAPGGGFAAAPGGGFVVSNQTMMAAPSFFVPHPAMLNPYAAAAAAPGFVQTNMPVLLQVNPAAATAAAATQQHQATAQHQAAVQQTQQVMAVGQPQPQPHHHTTMGQQQTTATVMASPHHHQTMMATQHHHHHHHPAVVAPIALPPVAVVKPEGVTMLDMSNSRKRGAATEGQPIRPLSAYNFFFSDEREKVLKESQQPQKTNSNSDVAVGGDNDTHNAPKENETVATADRPKIEGSIEEGEGINGVKVVVVEEELFEEKKKRLLAQHINKDRTKRRPHRKTHGKIGFTDLSKIIGKRWRELPEERKQIYRDIASADLERYQREVAEFNNDRLTKRAK